MAAVSRIPLVFIDSNVLYPVRVADLVLSSADDGLFEVCVSENLLVEIERVLIEVKGLAPEKAKVFTQAVASNSAQVVSNAQYIELASLLNGPDPDDLFHLAAAMEAGCDVVLTNNIDDFTKANVPDGRRVPAILTPDQFFSRLIADGLGEDLAKTVSRISAKLKKPFRSPTEILDGLEVCGLTETANSLRSYFLLNLAR
jgi:predicted nucleic acid-binding protein